MAQPTTDVLAISNDADFLNLVGRFLASFGYPTSCVAAGQCEEAVRLRTAEVVLVDVRTGGVDAAKLRRLADNLPCSSRLMAVVSDQREESLARLAGAPVEDVLEAGAWGELLCRLRNAARLREFQRRLASESGVDSQTLLPARAALVQHMERAVAQAQPVACLRLTLDVLAGGVPLPTPTRDRALRTAAETLLELSSGFMACCRDGDDGFLALVPGSEAKRWGESVVQALSTRCVSDGANQLSLSVSCGIALLRDGDQVDDLLRRAHEATAAALRCGGGRALTDAEHRQMDQDWEQQAEPEQLYRTTLACHLMTPLTWILKGDDTMGRAELLREQSVVDWLPVVDAEGGWIGLLSNDAAGEPDAAVAEFCDGSQPQVDFETPLGELLPLLCDPACDVVVVMRDGLPVGLIRSDELADLDLPYEPQAVESDSAAAVLLGAY